MAVSRCSYVEEDGADTNAYWGGDESILDGFVVAGVEIHRDALVLFACLNIADNYT